MLVGLVAVAVVLAVLIATSERAKPASNDSARGHEATSSSHSTAPSSAQHTSSNTRIATGSAAAELDTLLVKGRAPRTGYSRAQFGAAWTDDNGDPGGHNGCDTRNDILRRDLSDVAIKAGTFGCTVLTGTLHDPYTGMTIDFRRGETSSTAVQIDHVVALGDAWQTGAQRWSAAKRIDLANDPLNLLAVDGSANEQKGDGDAATWLPPNKTYRCAYVARQIAVKARYKLWVTPAEHVAIARILSTCPDQNVPTDAAVPLASSSGPGATARPVAGGATSQAGRPAASHALGKSAPPAPAAKVYANCAALNQDFPHGVGLPGAHDHTASGADPVTNFTPNVAVYEANSVRDRDADHIACEKH